MFDDRNLHYDLFAIGLLAGTIFLGLSLITYSPADPLGKAVFPISLVYQPDLIQYPTNTEVQNACGHTGAICADAMLRLFGVGSYYATLCVGLIDIWLLMRKPLDGASIRLMGWLASFASGLTMLEIFLPRFGMGPVIGPGGYLGALGRTILESHFATFGSVIVLASVLVGGLLLCTDYVFLHVAVLAATAIWNMAPRATLPAFPLLPRMRRSQRTHVGKRDAHTQVVEDVNGQQSTGEIATSDVSRSTFGVRLKGRRVDDLTSQLMQTTRAEAEGESETEAYDDEESGVEYEEEFEEEYGEDDDAATDGEWDEDVEAEEDETGTPGGTIAAVAGALSPTRTKLREGKSSTGAERDEVMAQLDEASRDHDPHDYELPPIDLLLAPESYSADELLREVQRKAALLEKTFQDFNLDVRVKDVETGPVIAQYEVELKRGLRLSKITGLADDLAIALRVPSVRIVAPIPGKNTVGIEVPNDQRQIVRLREVMEETSSRLKRMSIPVFLGKDVSGNPMAVDLASLPHLLIAGRTGTGKSVCLNAIITSILMTKTPDDVRMLMIDPKMVELSGYARLPHLMHPVVTDMRKAEAILAWACEKMDERYALLARAGVRHMNVYNQLGEEELMERLQPESEEERRSIPRHLPFIVIVADEMADLMITAGKEVEAHIIRLSAKSRAVGIHLILATQKPTVDVITGLIKSNLPARIAFQVASQTDSRVVLDENGANKLLGHGDMLFLWPGTSTLIRGQGTYLSDDEINRVVDYCGSKGEQNFVRELVQLKIAESESDGAVTSLKKRDELYEDAVDVVIREGRGSVSLLQRNLQIGYGRAARLIDFMAEDGIVGTYNGSQARDVLMSVSEWQSMRTGGSADSTPPATSDQLIAATNWSAAASRELDQASRSIAVVGDAQSLMPKNAHSRLHFGAEKDVSEELEDELDEEDDEFEEDELDEEDDEFEEDELEVEHDEEDYEDDVEGAVEDDEIEEASDGEEETEDDEEDFEEEDVEYEDEEDEADEEDEEDEEEALESEAIATIANVKSASLDNAKVAATGNSDVEYEDVEDAGVEPSTSSTRGGVSRRGPRKDEGRPDSNPPHKKTAKGTANPRFIVHRHH